MGAEQIVTLTGDDAALFKAYQRIIDQQVKMEKGLNRVSDQGKKAKQALKPLEESDFSEVNASLEEMSSFEFSNLTKGITATAAFGFAIRELSMAWEHYQKMQDQALKSREANFEANTRLVQIAKDDAHLLVMQQRADNAAIATGKTREEARKVLFSMISEGVEQDYEAVMAASPVVDPAAAATVAGKVPAIFNGKIGPMEAVAMNLKAAEESNLSFEQMAASMPSVAEGAVFNEATPAESWAALSVLAGKFKSGDVAADRIKTFGMFAGLRPELQGKGIMGAVEELDAMPDEERKKLLGTDQSVNVAYMSLSQSRDRIAAIEKKLIEEQRNFAQGTSTLENKIGIASRNPETKTVIEVNKARIDSELAKEQRRADDSGGQEVAKERATAISERSWAGWTESWSTYGTSNILAPVPGLSGETRAQLSNVVGAFISNSPLSGFGGRLAGIAAANAGDSKRTQVIQGDIDQSIKQSKEKTLQRMEIEKSQPPQVIGGSLATPGSEKLADALDRNNQLLEENNRLMRSNSPPPPPPPANPGTINGQFKAGKEM